MSSLLLHWMVGTVAIRADPAGNIKADKEKYTEKIDGAVATIMALDRVIRHEGTIGSGYNEMELLCNVVAITCRLCYPYRTGQSSPC